MPIPSIETYRKVSDFFISTRMMIYSPEKILEDANAGINPWGPTSFRGLMGFIDKCYATNIFDLAEIYFEYIKSDANYAPTHYTLRGKPVNDSKVILDYLKNLARTFESDVDIMAMVNIIMTGPLKKVS